MSLTQTTPPLVRKLRVLIAHNHEMIRQGSRTLLQTQSGWVVCGEVATGHDVVEKVRQLQPDVVVLGIHMPGIDGMETARQILKARPQTEILMLTVDESAEAIRAASQAGVRAVMTQSDASRDLVTAVSALSRHDEFYTPKISEIISHGGVRPLGMRQVVPDVPHSGLTKREREIVVLVAEGQSSKQIAATLNISVKTVESHRRNLMQKLGIKSMAQLVRYAVRQGLVEP